MAAQGIATKTLAETFRDGSAIHGILCARRSQHSVAEISGICAMLPRNGRENGLSSRRRARMAERRMFAKTIVTSDAFLDMPASARCLYFMLGLSADDDGFVNNPRSVMRQSAATDDDMKLLIAKRFVLTFESGVVVIKHWKIHNTIRMDRYTPTKYTGEIAALALDEKGAYTEGDGVPIDTKKARKPLTPAQQKRLDAKKESSLPYSFEYKIRAAFVGEKCPICGCTMSYNNNLVKPTVQHNTPISLGGKHEIDNISVICCSCNASTQNRRETGPLNNDMVKAAWERIENGAGMETQYRLGECSKGEYKLEEDNNIYSSSLSNAHTREERIDYLTGRMMDTDNPPTEAEIAEYKRIMRGETDG